MGIRSRWLAFAGVVAVVVAAGCTPPAGTTDTSPPRILSAAVSPTSATPGATVTLSADVTDATGTSTVLFQVFRPGAAPIDCLGGNLASRTAGVSTNGTWSRTCTLPAVMISGDYVVAPVAQDVRGNIATTGPQATLTITGGASDADPPLVDQLTAAPTSVARGQTVVVTAHVTDASGTSDVAFQIANPAAVLACYAGNTAARTDGSALDGTWTLNCYVPGTTAPGVYQIAPIAKDVLNNVLTPTTAPSITLTVT